MTRKRGPKPKPAHLHLVDGTFRSDRHGEEAAAKAAVEAVRTSFGPLTRPRFLKGEARRAWDRYIEPAGWLDATREPAAIAFCELWGEFRTAPASFNSSRHSQLRAYMNELGLTDERGRPAPATDESDEFFD